MRGQAVYLSCLRLNIQGVRYETQDGLYDVAWSEIHENQLVTASGDGSIRLWDVMLNVSLNASINRLFSSISGPPYSCVARTYSGSVLRGLV